MTASRLLGAVLTGALLLGVGGCGAVQRRLGDPCTIEVDGDERRLDRAQAMAATTIAAVGSLRSAPESSVATVLDHVLENATVTNLETATTAYDSVALDSLPSNESLALARALLGSDGSALTCRASVEGARVQNEAADGLTPRAGAMLGQIRDVFGEVPTGGFAPGGVSSGHVDGSAHYDGRAVDVFFRPVEPENRRRGWVLAHWAVAHAERLEIATVIFDDRIWSSGRSGSGWRTYRPGGDPDNAVLRHLDHVHLDVVDGG